MGVVSAGSVFAGYRIEAMLAEGGMGAVYKARQLSLERTVALKVIAAPMASDPQFRERFRREALAAAAIDHPHVVPVFEADESEGLLFLAMRLVDGIDFASLIDREGQIDAERAVRIVGQIASALDAAHERGLVHRDVKPANILVSEQTGRPEHAYLTDFGIARRLGARTALTRPGMVVGTVDYMAPEALRGERVGPAADVYSLGCVLFEALTGEIPFPRESEVAVALAHLNDPPPSLRERAATPPRLEAVVQRALAKRPEERFASTGALAEAAEAALGGGSGTRSETVQETGPLPAPPPSPAEPALPSRRPKRVWLAAGAIAFVAAAALAVAILTGSDPPATPESLSDAAVTRIPVGKEPLGLAVSPGAVWVANFGSDTVGRIEPRTRRMATAPLEAGRGPTDIAVVDGILWAAMSVDGGVSRIDPSSRRAQLVPIPATPFSVAASGDAVWVTHLEENAVSRIDPAARKVVATLEVGEGPIDVAVGEGAVWVANGDGGTVTRIDPVNNDVVDSIEVAAGLEGIAVGEGAVWVTSRSEDTVARIDPESGEVATEVAVGKGPEGIAVGDGAVWVANVDSGTLSRIDPQSNEVVGEIAVGEKPSGIAVGEGAIWVSHPDQNRVTRVVPD
jgi:YVTN family beta-propeller protein